jgi:hypothetical protein
VILQLNAPLMITWPMIDAVATVVAGRTEIGVAPVEYRVHGVEVCAPCAHRLRRRTIAEFVGLATATALASAAAYLGFVKFYQWTPWWGLVWLLSPPIALAAATSVTIRRMKERNRTGMPDGFGSESSPSSIAGSGRGESWRGHDALVRAPERSSTRPGMQLS